MEEKLELRKTLSSLDRLLSSVITTSQNSPLMSTRDKLDRVMQELLQFRSVAGREQVPESHTAVPFDSVLEPKVLSDTNDPTLANNLSESPPALFTALEFDDGSSKPDVENMKLKFAGLQNDFAQQSDVVEKQDQTIHQLSVQLEDSQTREMELEQKLAELKSHDEEKGFAINSLEARAKALQDQLEKLDKIEDQKRSAVLQSQRQNLKAEELPKFEFLEMSLNEVTKEKKDLKASNLELKIEKAEAVSKVKNLEKKCKELKGEIESFVAKEKDLKQQLVQKDSEAPIKSQKEPKSPNQSGSEVDKDHLINQMAKQIVDLKAELRNLENWKLDSDKPDQEDVDKNQESQRRGLLRSFVSRELFNELEEKCLCLQMDVEKMENELEKAKKNYKEECDLNTQLTSQRNAFRDNYSKLLLDSQHKNPHIQIDEFVQLRSQSVLDEAEIKELKLKTEELADENEKKTNEVETLKAKNEGYKQEMKKLISSKTSFGSNSEVNPDNYAKIVEENCEKTAEVKIQREKLSLLKDEMDSLRNQLEFSEEARKNLSDELKAMSMNVGGPNDELSPDQEVYYLKEKLCNVTASKDVLEKNELKLSAQLKKAVAEKSVLESQNQKLEAQVSKQVPVTASAPEKKKSSSGGPRNDSTEQTDCIKQLIAEKASQINQICKLEAENENLLNRVENLENKNSKCEQQIKTLSDEIEQLAKDKEEVLKGQILENLDDENKTLSFVENIASSKIKLDQAKFEVSDLQQRLKEAESSLKKSVDEGKQLKLTNGNLRKEMTETYAQMAKNVGLQDIASEFASCKSRCDELKSEVLHLENCLKEAGDTETGLRNELAVLQSENEVLSSSLASSVTDRGQLDEINELIKYKTEAVAQQCKIDNLDSEIEKLYEENKESSNKCEALEKYCQKLSGELEKVISNEGSSGNPLEETEEKLKLQVALEQYDERFRDLSNEYSLLQEANEQLGHEKRILQNSLDEVLADVDDPVKELVSLKQQLEIANVEMTACQTDLQKAKDNEMKLKQELETSKLVHAHPNLEESSFFQSSFSVSETPDNSELKAESFELRLRNKELEDQVSYLKSSKQRLEGEIEIALEKSPHSIARDLIHANQEISHLEVERDTLKEQLKAIQVPATKSAGTRSTSAVAVLTPTAISRVDSRLSEAMKEIDSLKDIKKRLSEEVQELVNESSNNDDSLSLYPKMVDPKRLTPNILNTLSEVESCNEVLSVSMDALQREVESYREALALQSDEKQDLILENSSLKTEVDRLKKMTSSKSGAFEKPQASFAPPVKPIPNEEFVLTQKKLIDTEDQVLQLSNLSNQLEKEKKNLLARIDTLSKKNEELHMKTFEMSQNSAVEQDPDNQSGGEQYHRVKDLEAENSALSAQLQNSRTAEKQIRETMKSLEIDKAKLESKVGPLKKGAALRNMDPSERIKELEAVEKLLKKKHNEIEKKYDAENVKAKELELENLQYQKRQESLLESEKQLVLKVAEIEKLQKDLNASNESVKYLRQNLQELEEEAAKADQIVQEAPITAIQSDPTVVESAPEQMSSQVKDEKIALLEGENKVLKEQIDEMKKASPKTGKTETKTKGELSPKTAAPFKKPSVATKPKKLSATSPSETKPKFSASGKTGADKTAKNKSGKEKSPDDALPVERIAQLEAENEQLKHELKNRPSKLLALQEEKSVDLKAEEERQRKILEDNLKRKVEEIKDAELKYQDEIKDLQSKLDASEKQWENLRQSNLVSIPQLEEIEKIKEKHELVEEEVVSVSKEPALKSGRKLESLESSGKILKANIKGAENLLAIVNLEQQLEASENEREKLRVENEEIKEKFEQANVKMAEKEATLLELSEANHKLTEVSTSNDSSLKDIHGKVEQIKTELSQCQNELGELRNNSAGDLKDIEKHVKNVLDRLLDFEDDVKEKETKIHSLNEDLDITNEALNELSNDFENLKKEKDSVLQDLDKAKQENEKLLTENDEKISQMKSEKELLLDSVKKLESELLEKDAEIVEKKQEIQKAMESSEKKAQDVESLNNASNKLEELLSQQKTNNAEISEKNKSLTKNLEKFGKEKSDLERQLEKTASDLETARSMREEIKEKLLENERKVLQQKSEIDKANGIKKEQLAKIESLEEMLKHNADKIKSLEDQVKKLASNLSQAEDEKRKLNILLQDSEDLGKRAENREKNLRKEVENLSKELQRETDSLLKSTKDLKTLQDKNSKLLRDYETLKEQSQLKDEINEQLEQAENEARAKISELSRENKKLENQLQNCKDEIFSLQGDVSDLSESEKALKTKVADLKNDNTGKQKKIEASKEEIANLKSEIEQLNENLASAETARKTLERSNNEISRELDQINKSLKEGENSLRSTLLENEINSGEVAKLRSQNTVLQQKLKDRNEDLAEKETEIGQLAFKLQQADKKLREEHRKFKAEMQEREEEKQKLESELDLKASGNDKLRDDVKDLKG